MIKKLALIGGMTTASLIAGVSVAMHAIPGAAAETPRVTGNQSTPGLIDQQPQRPQLAQASSALPGGASSLNETYKDWRVSCQQEGTNKRCALSQIQAQQNGQRVLAIELNPPNGNTISGTLILPFGLALESGIALQIDEKPLMQPIRFRSCLPVGCLVPVAFDAPTLAVLRTATALKVKAVADGGTAAPFSISLQGFAAGLDRMGALMR